MNTYTAIYRDRHNRRRQTILAESWHAAWKIAANIIGLTDLISVRPAR